MIRNYRSQLPFSDDILAQIRKDVMTQVERETRAERTWMGLFLRATLAASALAVVLLWPSRRVDEPTSRRVNPAPRIVHVQSAPVVVVAEKPLVPSATRPRPVKRIVQPVSAEPVVMRIELQTSDPDVRIIWFTNDSGDTR